MLSPFFKRNYLPTLLVLLCTISALSLFVLELVALLKGINGHAFAVCMAVFGGIVGGTIKSVANQFAGDPANSSPPRKRPSNNKE